MHAEAFDFTFPNEQAAAFDLSRREFRNGMAEIIDLVAQGLHVVAISGPAYCRFTDAIVGVSYHVISTHLSRKVADRIASNAAIEAYEAGGFDGDVHVFPKPPAPPAPTLASILADFEDDIPF